jgi:hypothetical protein
MSSIAFAFVPVSDRSGPTVIELDHQFRRTTTCTRLINEYRVAALNPQTTPNRPDAASFATCREVIGGSPHTPSRPVKVRAPRTL